MKITPSLPGNRPASTTEQARANKSSVQTSTSSSASLSADDITQAGLQTAQQTLNSDTQSDVDYDKVAQMQAMLPQAICRLIPINWLGTCSAFSRNKRLQQ